MHLETVPLPFALAQTDMTVGDVVATEMFAVGLAYGALAYLVLGLAALVRRRRFGGGGLAVAVAVVCAVLDVFGTDDVPPRFVVALGVLAIGGAVATRVRPRRRATWQQQLLRSTLALAPGCVALTLAFPLAEPGWLRFAAGIATLVGAVLVHDFDVVEGKDGGPFWLFAIAAAGVFLTVPDTELPLVLLGAMVPLALLSVPQSLRALGGAGCASAIGVYCWVSAIGARGRPGSFVAAFLCLGLLIVMPVARRIPQSPLALSKRVNRRKRRHEPPVQERWLVVIGVATIGQVLAVLYLSQLAGREQSMIGAALIAAPAIVVLGATGPALLPSAEPPPEPPPRPYARRPWRHLPH